MPFEASNFDQLKLILKRVGNATDRAVMKALVEKGVELRDLARAGAPVDYGNLEQAIKLQHIGDLRGSSGRFLAGGGSVMVYIDNSMPAPSTPGEKGERTVGDYAWYIHENQTPYGPIPLGPKSQEKQDANPEVVVGGGFMDRAADIIGATISQELANIVKKQIMAVD